MQRFVLGLLECCFFKENFRILKVVWPYVTGFSPIILHTLCFKDRFALPSIIAKF